MSALDHLKRGVDFVWLWRGRKTGGIRGGDSHLGDRPEVSTAIYTKTVKISADCKSDLCSFKGVMLEVERLLL